MLVGHGEKVSIILAKDYKPFEYLVEESSFYDEDISKNILKKELATEKVFHQLKVREDELKNEFKKHIKRSAQSKSRNKFQCDESFSFIEGLDENTKKKIIQFREEQNISGISFNKTDDSLDDLEDEEKFQRLLTKTVSESVKKKRKKPRSRVFILNFIYLGSKDKEIK